jgi:hypothetical protein
VCIRKSPRSSKSPSSRELTRAHASSHEVIVRGRMTKASRTSRSHTSSHESPTRVSSRDTRVTRVSSRGFSESTRDTHKNARTTLSYTPTRDTQRFVHDAHRDGGRHRPQCRTHARVTRNGARSGHTKRASPLDPQRVPCATRARSGDIGFACDA